MFYICFIRHNNNDITQNGECMLIVAGHSITNIVRLALSHCPNQSQSRSHGTDLFVNRNFRMRLKNRPTEIDRTWLHVPSGTLGPPAVTLTKWYKC